MFGLWELLADLVPVRFALVSGHKFCSPLVHQLLLAGNRDYLLVQLMDQLRIGMILVLR